MDKLVELLKNLKLNDEDIDYLYDLISNLYS